MHLSHIPGLTVGVNKIYVPNMATSHSAGVNTLFSLRDVERISGIHFLSTSRIPPQVVPSPVCTQGVLSSPSVATCNLLKAMGILRPLVHTALFTFALGNPIVSFEDQGVGDKITT